MCDKTVKLANGLSMPLLGLGTWKAKPGEGPAAVKKALQIGYRHFDTAAVYGNEEEVGEGIRAAIQEFGIKREEIFVVSKLWNTKHHPDDVEPEYRKSLSKLGLEYLDLYLIHWPQAYKRGDIERPKNPDGTTQYEIDISPTDTWFAMEKLVKKGLVKSIGVSNFNSMQIKDILEKGTIVPVTNQVECHPYLTQEKLLDFCKSHNIVLTAYSPLGSPGSPWVQEGLPRVLDDPRLLEITKKHGKNVAQVLLRWQIQRGVAAIPRSVNPLRIEENFNVFDFSLSGEEMKQISSFNRGNEGRLIPMTNDKTHPHFSFGIEF